MSHLTEAIRLQGDEIDRLCKMALADKDEIERLRERCEAYKGQVRDGALVIDRLRAELELWKRRPDLGCDGKCKDEECFCGFRAWDRERETFDNQQEAQEK